MDAMRNGEIYRREFAGWLPERVLDCHIHVWPGEAFSQADRSDPHNLRGHFPGGYTFEMCREDAAKLMPEQRFHGLYFGTPHEKVNRVISNEYTARECDNETRFGLAMVAPEDTADELLTYFRNGDLLGYKPYRNFVKGKEREEVGIHDMLPAAQMALAEELGLVIMLHIPRAARLADPDNQREIMELAAEYPRAQIVLAHIGRAYYLSNIVGQLDRIRQYPNVYVDLAMLNHAEVLEYLFREFPLDRALFGTDMPVSCLGGKSVEVNDQYVYLTEEDVRFGACIHDADRVLEFTWFYYEELRSIRRAAEKVGLSGEEIKGIFFDNAMGLLGGVARRLGSHR